MGKVISAGESVMSREGHAALPLTDSDVLDGELAQGDVEPAQAKDAELVLNLREDGKLHAIKVGAIDVDPWHWSSHCGWHFGRDRAHAQRTSNWIIAPLCPTCF